MVGDLIAFASVYRVRPTVLSRMRAITRRCCEDNDQQPGIERSIQVGCASFCLAFRVFAGRLAKTVVRMDRSSRSLQKA